MCAILTCVRLLQGREGKGREGKGREVQWMEGGFRIEGEGRMGKGMEGRMGKCSRRVIYGKG